MCTANFIAFLGVSEEWFSRKISISFEIGQPATLSTFFRGRGHSWGVSFVGK